MGALEARDILVIRHAMFGEQIGHHVFRCLKSTLPVLEPALFGQQIGVERNNRVFQDGPIGNPAVGMVSNDRPGFVSARRHMGLNPIMIPVLAPVLDISEDFAAILNGFPEQAENAPWHIWVADKIVRLTETFFFGVSSNAQKDIVAIGQPPLQVRFADNEFVFIEKLLNTGDEHVL